MMSLKVIIDLFQLCYFFSTCSLTIVCLSPLSEEISRHASLFNPGVGGADFLGKVLVEQLAGGAGGDLVAAGDAAGLGHNSTLL